MSFNISRKHNSIEIKGTLSGSHTYDSILIERSSSPSFFNIISELPAGSNAGEHSFSFMDNTAGIGVIYYRIVLFNTVQNIQEISNTLMLRVMDEESNLKVYNSILQAGDPSISVYSTSNDQVSMQLTDMSGSVLYHGSVQLNPGMNSVSIPSITATRKYCLLVIKNKARVITQKMIIQ